MKGNAPFAWLGVAQVRLIAGLCLFLCVPLALGQIYGYSVMSNGNDHLYRINMATGDATDMGLINFDDAEGLSFGANGNLFAIGGTVDEFWNITSPPGSLIGGTGTRNGIDAGLGYFNGTMYNIQGGFSGSSLYTVDVNTGATTFVGDGGFYADNIAIRSDGIAFASDWIFDHSLYTVDLSTGAMTLVGSLGAGNTNVTAGSDFGGDGLLYNITSDGKIYTIDTSTGQATFVADVTGAGGSPLSGFEGLAIQSVPEPFTMALMGGAAVVGYRRVRRRRA